jgi:hypothetical protein
LEVFSEIQATHFPAKPLLCNCGSQPLIVYTSGCDKWWLEMYWKSASKGIYFGMEQGM